MVQKTTNNEWKQKTTTERNFWNPDKQGDEIIGIVEKIIEGNYGKQYIILDENGSQVWTPSHRYLQSLMEDVEVGEMVKIVFEGFTPSTTKGKNPTAMYKVFVKE